MKWILLLLLIPSVALAGKPPQTSSYAQAQSNAYASAFAPSESSVGDVTVGQGDTTVNSKTAVDASSHDVRQAPSVGLVVPPSTMDCAKGFGIGGSNETGSMLIGWSWLQRDCMALKQFELLRALELHGPAAEAYCARPIFRKPFVSRETCISQVSGSGTTQVIHVKVSDGQEECRLRATGQTEIKEFRDNGTTVIYDCMELEGKGQ